MTDFPIKGVAVDGYCIGNPGPGGYKGVSLETGATVFKAELPLCTNNIAEFLAVVEALKAGFDPVYTDSMTAINWVKKTRANTTLDSEEIQVMLFQAGMWLRLNRTHGQVLYWQTREWGECPADLGRK